MRPLHNDCATQILRQKSFRDPHVRRVHSGRSRIFLDFEPLATLRRALVMIAPCDNLVMNTSQPFQKIESPCIKVCEVNSQTNVCTGCHRTLDEIGSWTSLTHAERAAIMQSLPLRAVKNETKNESNDHVKKRA